MMVVGIRELKNRLSEYLRLVRGGQRVLITDRGEAVAELRQPCVDSDRALPPALQAYVHAGRAEARRPNDPAAYPELAPLVSTEEVLRLLEEERRER